MHTFVVIVRSLFGTLFLLLTFVLVPVWMIGSTVSRVVVDPQNIKTWVAETEVYDDALDITVTLLTQLVAGEDGEDANGQGKENSGEPKKTDAENGGEENNFLTSLIAGAQDSTTEYGQFAQKIFAPQRLQLSVETIVDAFYAWFRGETALPEFEVRLLDSREDMIRLLTLAFREKFNALPICPLSSLASATVDFNPLEASCRPIFFTDAIVDEFMKQLVAQPEIGALLDSTALKGSALDIPPEVVPQIQLGYMALRWLSLALGGVILLFAGLFLLVFPWSKRVPLLGGLFVALGGAGAVGWGIGRSQVPALVELVMSRIPPNFTVLASEYVQPLIQQVVSTLAQMLLWHTVVVAAVGVVFIGVWVIVHTVRNR